MTFYRPVAPVLEVYLGQDGVMRSAKAKLPNTELIRPSGKLCLLECAY